MKPAAFELQILDGPLTDGHAGSTAVVAELHGDVDSTNVLNAEARLTELADGRPLVVDLSEAAYFDSAAFAMLYRLLNSLELSVVLRPGSMLRAAAELIRLPFHDSVEAALACET